MSHARLSPSSAHRWMRCAGAPAMSDGFADSENEYQAEGTRAHEQAARALLGHAGEYDPQIAADIQPYLDAVREAMQEPGAQLYVERRVTAHTASADKYSVFGTADAIVMSRGRLTVFDLKYGRGVVVEAKDNPQLLTYLAGAVRELWGFPFMQDDATDVFEVVVVQPRAPHADGPVRRAEYTHEQVLEFASDLRLRVLRAAENDVKHQSGEPLDLTPGDWCRFCPAKGECPALYKQSMALAQTDFEVLPAVMPPAPETLPIEVCADILGKLEIVEIWMHAIRERVQRELEAGREVPGWKLVAKRAQRQWADPFAVREWAHKAGIVADDLYEPREIKSVAQIEKLVGKKKLPAELVVSVSSGATVAPASDKRPAIASAAQEEFAALPRGASDVTHGETEGGS